MTISSSLNASVAGLFANATKLATVSDNIANSETYGYRRADADFSSLVLTADGGGYTAGGVRAASTRLVDQQGSLVTTDNATDIAIGGRGMLPVTTLAAVNNTTTTLPFLMTPTGSFRPNDEGYLVNPAGLVLMGWAADATGAIPTPQRDSDSSLSPVQIDLNQFAASPTTTISLGVNLPSTAAAAAFAAGTPGTTLPLPTAYFDTLGANQTLNLNFTPTGAAANEWTLDITDGATTPATTIGAFTVTFDTTAGQGGSILSVTTPGANGESYSTTTGQVSLTLASGDAMTVDIGTPASSTGLTQLSAEFAPTAVTKDGFPAGAVIDVEVDENGFINTIYETGFVRTVYQIPIADVPNLNGLKPYNNQTYQVSGSSGAFYLWDAGEGPTGEVISYALEESTTDVARELTQLIQTQRAYSSNASVIRTVDEMLQETTNLKR